MKLRSLRLICLSITYAAFNLTSCGEDSKQTQKIQNDSRLPNQKLIGFWTSPCIEENTPRLIIKFEFTSEQLIKHAIYFSEKDQGCQTELYRDSRYSNFTLTPSEAVPGAYTFVDTVLAVKRTYNQAPPTDFPPFGYSEWVVGEPKSIAARALTTSSQVIMPALKSSGTDLIQLFGNTGFSIGAFEEPMENKAAEPQSVNLDILFSRDNDAEDKAFIEIEKDNATAKAEDEADQEESD